MPHPSKGRRAPSGARKSARNEHSGEGQELPPVTTVQAVGHLSLLLLCLAALGASCYAFYLYYLVPALGTPGSARSYQDAPWVPVGASVEGPRRVCNFSLDLGAPVHIVDDRFVSFNLDAALFQRSWDWLELDLE
ncbi:hypothetical protein V5799_017483 [Amblyomma americanum]|uniref:Uncharacterized protein n=1 Tax=Amblyomma americanum TaxID=6943 RepID=A0AAQ4F258_AMBAM